MNSKYIREALKSLSREELEDALIWEWLVLEEMLSPVRAAMESLGMRYDESLPISVPDSPLARSVQGKGEKVFDKLSSETDRLAKAAAERN